MSKYVLFGFSNNGYLRAVARGYPFDRIERIEKDEKSKGNTCIIAREEKWDDVPKKYKTNMYWVTSCDPKDKERISKILNRTQNETSRKNYRTR